MEKINQNGLEEKTVESIVEQSIEERKESLRTEFLAELEKTLLDEHLTVQQLEVLVKRAGTLTVYDDKPIDHFYVSDFEKDPHGSGFPTSRGLRGPLETYGNDDVKLGSIMSEVFDPIHRKGLKSNLRRHNDGLHYDSIGITGSDIKGIFQRTLEQTKTFREEDTEQEYDKGVLRSYIARYAPNNWPPFVSAIKLLDAASPEQLQLNLKEFKGGVNVEHENTTDMQGAIYFLSNLPNHLGSDIAEVSVHVLRDILKSELLELETIYAEAAAKKGNNYQI